MPTLQRMVLTRLGSPPCTGRRKSLFKVAWIPCEFHTTTLERNLLCRAFFRENQVKGRVVPQSWLATHCTALSPAYISVSDKQGKPCRFQLFTSWANAYHAAKRLILISSSCLRYNVWVWQGSEAHHVLWGENLSSRLHEYCASFTQPLGEKLALRSSFSRKSS